MPLPILIEREYDEGLYDGWLYDARAVGPRNVPAGAKGGIVSKQGDQRPGGPVQKK